MQAWQGTQGSIARIRGVANAPRAGPYRCPITSRRGRCTPVWANTPPAAQQTATVSHCWMLLPAILRTPRGSRWVPFSWQKIQGSKFLRCWVLGCCSQMPGNLQERSHCMPHTHGPCGPSVQSNASRFGMSRRIPPGVMEGVEDWTGWTDGSGAQGGISLPDCGTQERP